MKKSCPVCLSNAISFFLTRPNVPVHQNLVMKDQHAALTIKKGDLELKHCKSCGFMFNQAFDVDKVTYGQLYDNTQELSSIFKQHLDSLVHHLVYEKGVQKCSITEVGCGKGGFLKLLTEKSEWENRGHGYDPTYIGPDHFFEGRLKFEKKFFDEEASHLSTDVVICRHVIEHIEKPVDFLKLIRKALRSSPHARLFFETPCLKWILKNLVFWDFFYEHCSYFTANSLKTAFELAGFQVECVRHVFGGQYLWLEAVIPSKPVSRLCEDSELESLIKKYITEEEKLKQKWKEQISALTCEHKMALWGAGAKGVTFANLIDPERACIECLIDINPGKQNFFTPGSGHPICSYTEAAKRGVSGALIMNANYRDESQQLLKNAGIKMELLNF